MSEGGPRARAKAAPAQDARLAPLLREAHAWLRLWKTCNDGACRHHRRCSGDADGCGARAAGASWAWLKQVVAAVLAGKSLQAAAKAANLARLPYRARKILRWPGVPCWDPVEFVQLHNGKWVRIDQAPAVAPLDPQVVALLASGWLRSAVREMEVEMRPPPAARPRPSNASARRAALRAKVGMRGGARQTRLPAHTSRRRAIARPQGRSRPSSTGYGRA
jgi:hypothetical protein